MLLSENTPRRVIERRMEIAARGRGWKLASQVFKTSATIYRNRTHAVQDYFVWVERDGQTARLFACRGPWTLSYTLVEGDTLSEE